MGVSIPGNIQIPSGHRPRHPALMIIPSYFSKEKENVPASREAHWSLWQKISTPSTWKGILSSANHKQKLAVTHFGFPMTGLVFWNAPGVKPQRLKLRIYSQVWLRTVNAFYSRHWNSQAAELLQNPPLMTFISISNTKGEKNRCDRLLKLP